jgi:hypothetical protein
MQDPYTTRVVARAVGIAAAASVFLGILILVGSRNLDHFDAALVGYTSATLFATFGVAYRYVMWLERPPTAVYWRRGWTLFLTPRYFVRNLAVLVQRLVMIVGLNSFIWRRDKKRGAAHGLVMWGCIVAALITFPLVFGWVHFESVPGDVESYQTMAFGFPAFRFRVDSLVGHLLFHGLVFAGFLVIAGVMLAMHRRMRDRDALALQSFGEDWLPLVALFAVSITGLMLTVSYTWLHGYAYTFLSLFHEVTVILTLVWMPFGKFFHIFQRPAQLGVAFYRDVAKRAEQAQCLRCGCAYAAKFHVDDLIEVEKRLGYRYEMSGGRGAHYQEVCPRCRRLLLGIAQGALTWRPESPT